MSQTIIITGMVLSASPVGEFDKRVVLLTKEQGKISAFAKGARRPNSPLIGMINPFSFGEFTLYQGRTAYTVVQVSISNYFNELRENIEGAYYGFYFMDFASYYTSEHNDEKMMLKLLYQTMRVLVKRSITYPLVRYIFELKAVCINGEGPQVFQCVTCGDESREKLFSPLKGGLICGECNGGVIDGIRIDTSTLYTLQYVVSSSIEKLYTFTVSDEVLKNFKYIMERYMDIYVDKRFKSLEILEMILKT